MYDVKNKTVLITGATGGFGAALAARVASKGGKLVLGDINETKGGELVSLLNRASGTPNAIFHRCDVGDFAALRTLFEFGSREFGGIHVVVNNAGIVERKRLSADSTGEWQRVLNVDLAAVIEGTRLAFEFVNPKEGGVVVNVTSMAGIYPLKVAPVYTAAKFGVVGFSVAVSMQAQQRKVRVNCVAPSFADTSIVKTDVAHEADALFMRETIRKSGMVTVAQVVDAMMLLIEDDSLAGDVAMVTAQRGITIRGKSVAGGRVAMPKTVGGREKASL